VVYVIDHSLSMGPFLDRARSELLQSLRTLPPEVMVQVLAYNHVEPHFLVAPECLLPANPETIACFVQALEKLTAWGKTDHFNALRRALLQHADALYLLTDGDGLTPRDVQLLTNLNDRRTAIHVIEIVPGRTPRPDSPLLQLATHNHGTYRYVAATQLVTTTPVLAPQ
jgi:hypothetical protein